MTSPANVKTRLGAGCGLGQSGPDEYSMHTVPDPIDMGDTKAGRGC